MIEKEMIVTETVIVDEDTVTEAEIGVDHEITVLTEEEIVVLNARGTAVLTARGTAVLTARETAVLTARGTAVEIATGRENVLTEEALVMYFWVVLKRNL